MPITAQHQHTGKFYTVNEINSDQIPYSGIHVVLGVCGGKKCVAMHGNVGNGPFGMNFITDEQAEKLNKMIDHSPSYDVLQYAESLIEG